MIDANEIEELLAWIRPEGRADSEDIPERHLTALFTLAIAMTMSESPKGGSWIRGSNWRAYLGFLRRTGLAPGAVTSEVVNAWYASQ